jgi:hypothetical protein
VAGPAIGFTLSQAVILFSFLIFFRHDKYELLLAYSLLRSKCDDKTRSELDGIDARVIFNGSTGVALLIIALLIALSIEPVGLHLASIFSLFFL